MFLPLRLKYHELRDELAMFIAWKLPPRVVAWAAVRMHAFASRFHPYEEEGPNMSYADAAKIWHDYHKNKNKKNKKQFELDRGIETQER